MIQTDLYSFSFKTGTLVPWCKKCGCENFYCDGKTSHRQQLYKCKSCGFRFVWCSDLPNKRFFSNVINFAKELYTSLIGISLRTLTSVLNKLNIKVSHEGIRQWILEDDKPHFIDYNINNLQTWCADETYIKIKGVGLWLWVVYAKETRQVLAWHISKGRFFTDAKLVLQKAKLVAGGRPAKIITDGLYQYAAAIKKVMGWKWNIYLQNHIVDSGIGKNAFIERVNKEIKRRIKWFGTFQCLEGAESFFKLFFHNFNKRTSKARNTG